MESMEVESKTTSASGLANDVKHIFIYSPASSSTSKSSSSSSASASLRLNELMKVLGAQKQLFLVVSSSLNEALHERDGKLPWVVLLTETTNDKSIRVLIEETRNKRRLQSLFIAVFDPKASSSALHREVFYDLGVNIVSGSPVIVSNAIIKATDPKYFGGPKVYTCPACSLSGLNEDGLWEHTILYHIGNPNSEMDRHICPICGANGGTHHRGHYAVHLRNEHGPCARGEIEAEDKRGAPSYCFALVVCRRPSDGKFLLVQEVCHWGWWLPGGRVEVGEKFTEAAVRETLEEAGVNVKLTGVLRVEHSPHSNYSRFRVIFLAEPCVDTGPNDDLPDGPGVYPKSMPDWESFGAAWVSVKEMEKLPMRGTEPLLWCPFVETANAKKELIAAPLSFFTRESADIGNRSHVKIA